ncbi:hypothetical protein [Collimonas sp.]|jgi:hypothetical protein|uniref:hypothetical protein n=1 Tax=Collimonas sp. TaxID=1963772 RepID=UPI002C9A0F91|nr:hypothetical protein [Collimonas sp.]HWW07604.1 hypothetical protein [Collimonas sp.]
MDRQTKYLLVGTMLAVLILLGGYLTSIYDNSQLLSLIEKCKTDMTHAEKGPWLEYQKDPLVCDPKVLSQLVENDAVGIQKQIVESVSTAGNIFNGAKIIALFVFLLFGSPYAWYFLLRRIRELRDAVAGK